MNLSAILLLMMIALLAGKHSKRFGAREYTFGLILAALQAGITVYRMMVMPMPPLF